MSRKLPSVRQVQAPSALADLKAIVEAITGRHPQYRPIEPLPATASQADIIAKLNELIERIQS